jgi:hypothetical protein
MLQSIRIRAAKAVDGMKILRGFFLMWVRLPPPAPVFLLVSCAVRQNRRPLAMSASIPKRQHFIARMLLQRFADENGKLFFFSKQFPAKGVLATTPQNLFCQTHIYTAKDKHGAVDVGLERSYAKLEGLANAVIEKIVASARNGDKPHLTTQERDIWDFFFYNQWQRVPDFHRKFVETEKFESQLKKATAAFEANYRPLTPDEERDLQDPLWLERIKQNAKIDTLRRSSPRILAFLKEKGLGIAVIRKPGKSFVIGSFPVVKLAHPGRQHIADPTVEIWLPVAHDVAVSPAPVPSPTELLIEIQDDSPVRTINAAIFKQSTAIAGRSQALIASLSRAR